DGLSAHHQLLLSEFALEVAAETLPPRAVELLDHDLINNDIVARRLPAFVAPQSLGRSACVRRQAAEAPCKFVADCGVVRGGEWVPRVVIYRQEQVKEGPAG